MTTTPNLLIEHIAANQAQKEVTANAAFEALDAYLRVPRGAVRPHERADRAQRLRPAQLLALAMVRRLVRLVPLPWARFNAI